MNLMKHGRGRPRKYGRPSRPITVTLPEDVLVRLRAIDADLGRAIVTIIERLGRPPGRQHATPPAELSSYGNHAVIVVTPIKALKRLAGVQLVPIGNGRALISLQPSYSIPQLDVDIRDVIESGEVKGPEREALEAIADLLRRARLSSAIKLKERTIIVLESLRATSRAT